MHKFDLCKSIEVLSKNHILTKIVEFFSIYVLSENRDSILSLSI